MLKIVDVHQSDTASGEYVVLQNHGLTTVSLHGWCLCTDAYLSPDPVVAARSMYVFVGDIPIRPYTRVVLFTGPGNDGWRPTTDGKMAYVAFWDQDERVWSRVDRVSLLQPICTRKIGVTTEATVAVT